MCLRAAGAASPTHHFESQPACRPVPRGGEGIGSIRRHTHHRGGWPLRRLRQPVTSHQVLRAQEGDREAFAGLIRAAYDRLFATAYRITRDREAAEDAVQESMLRCWRDIRGLRDPDRFEAWLYRLLVNACRDQVRRASRRPVMSFGVPEEHASGTDPFASMVEHDALERAFLKLSADQRIALVLAHYLGYSAPEIAEIVGVATGTVYSRLHYGARAMRTALSPPLPAATPNPRSTE